MLRMGVAAMGLMLWAAVVHGQVTDRAAAEQVWKQMLAAKGEVDAVRTIRVKEMYGSLLEPKPRAAQVVMARLPGQWWWYFEEPKPLGDGLRVFDLEKQTGWEWSGGEGGRVRSLAGQFPAAGGADGEAGGRRSYLMDWGTTIEARTLAVTCGAAAGFRPEPESVAPLKEGLRTVDRLTVRWREFVLVYDLDRRSHLPERVDLQRTIPAHDLTSHPVGRPVETRHIPEAITHEIYEMREYHEVSGVKVPGRVRRRWGSPGVSSGRWGRWEVEINPELSPELFTEAPRSVTETRGWTRFAWTAAEGQPGNGVGRAGSP